jgi:predicted Zn finger-like uncharacterized protein
MAYAIPNVRAPSSGFTTPSFCPTCRSSSIVTTAKVPDAGSYWRCTTCGEIWNAQRSKDIRPGRQRWH